MKATRMYNVAALVSLALVAAAPGGRALSTTTYTLTSQGTINFTALPGTAGQSGTLEFLFSPDANGFAPAKVTASNFVYAGNWQVNTQALVNDQINVLFGGTSQYLVGHYGYTTGQDANGNTTLSTVSLYNNGTNADGDTKTSTQTNSSVTIPFTSIGDSGSFGLQYFDPPTTADFSLQENNTTLLTGTFDPNGNFTQTGGTATFTPAAGTDNAVPEPSSLALMATGGLLLLGGVKKRLPSRLS